MNRSVRLNRAASYRVFRSLALLLAPATVYIVWPQTIHMTRKHELIHLGKKRQRALAIAAPADTIQ